MKYRRLSIFVTVLFWAPSVFAGPCDGYLLAESSQQVQERIEINQEVMDTAEKLRAKGVDIEVATLNRSAVKKIVIMPVQSGSPLNRLAWALRYSDFPISIECSPADIKIKFPQGTVGGYFSPDERKITLIPSQILSAVDDFGGIGSTILLHEVEHWGRHQWFVRGKDQLLNSRIDDGKKSDTPEISNYKGSFSIDELKTYSGDLYRESKVSGNRQRTYEIDTDRVSLIKDFCERLDKQIDKENAQRLAKERWSIFNLIQNRVGEVKDKRTATIYRLSHQDIAIVLNLFPQWHGVLSVTKNAAARALVDEVEAEKLRTLKEMSNELKEWTNRVSFFLKSGPNFNEGVKQELFQIPRKTILKYMTKWGKYLEEFSARPEVNDPAGYSLQ